MSEPLHGAAPEPTPGGGSVSAATRRGMHDLFDALEAAPRGQSGPGGAARGYRPGRTLGVGVEIRRQIGRRRTQISFGLLAVLPIVLALLFVH